MLEEITKHPSIKELVGFSGSRQGLKARPGRSVAPGSKTWCHGWPRGLLRRRVWSRLGCWIDLEMGCSGKKTNWDSILFDFFRFLDHLTCCKNPWKSGSFWSVKISGWDPAKSVPCCFERNLLFNKTLTTSDGGFIQIFGCLYLPKIGCLHQIQFEDLRI